jgi:hypothetical protein
VCLRPLRPEKKIKKDKKLLKKIFFPINFVLKFSKIIKKYLTKKSIIMITDCQKIQVPPAHPGQGGLPAGLRGQTAARISTSQEEQDRADGPAVSSSSFTNKSYFYE